MVRLGCAHRPYLQLLQAKGTEFLSVSMFLWHLGEKCVYILRLHSTSLPPELMDNINTT